MRPGLQKVRQLVFLVICAFVPLHAFAQDPPTISLNRAGGEPAGVAAESFAAAAGAGNAFDVRGSTRSAALSAEDTGGAPDLASSVPPPFEARNSRRNAGACGQGSRPVHG